MLIVLNLVNVTVLFQLEILDLMAISKFVLKTIKGIDRPAIAGILPTMKGQTVVLDLGANVDCTNENLVQFALMGDIFSKIVIGIKNPVLGLLNVGSEQIKGNSVVKQTFEDLKKQKKLIFMDLLKEMILIKET